MSLPNCNWSKTKNLIFPFSVLINIFSKDEYRSKLIIFFIILSSFIKVLNLQIKGFKSFVILPKIKSISSTSHNTYYVPLWGNWGRGVAHGSDLLYQKVVVQACRWKSDPGKRQSPVAILGCFWATGDVCSAVRLTVEIPDKESSLS